ncbi:hypothetical protein ABGN05_13375 [Aquibium sp. LZ166]|uniref:Uncharacterized protein n=1 Tax=Aquibium pacificus TaxID=3153579 RepID=A0ABV3SIS9_9HYPH
MRKTILAALGLALCLGSPAAASDTEFLQSLEGNWTGGGPVRMTAASKPVNVSCRIVGDAGSDTISLNGDCRAMLVFSTRLGAELKVSQGRYAGSYVGSPRGTADLAGSRNGRTLELALQWPGHPQASMTLASPSENVMILTTVEKHPETGKPVETARLELKRD